MKKINVMLTPLMLPPLMFLFVVFLVGFVFVGNDARAADYFKSHSISLGKVDEAKWEVVAYQVKEPDYSIYPARLCFERNSEQVCHLIVKKKGNNKYPFQMISGIDLLPKEIISPGVLVKSDHTGTVDGLTALDVWVYDKSRKDIVNVLPNCVLVGPGGHRLIANKKDKKGITLITAERIWGGGEAIDGAHQYKLTVYSISGKSSKKMLEYFTKNRYSIEGIDPGKIIDLELPGIFKKISVHNGR